MERKITRDDLAKQIRQTVKDYSVQDIAKTGVVVFSAGFVSLGMASYILTKFIGKQIKSIIGLMK